MDPPFAKSTKKYMDKLKSTNSTGRNKSGGEKPIVNGCISDTYLLPMSARTIPSAYLDISMLRRIDSYTPLGQVQETENQYAVILTNEKDLTGNGLTELPEEVVADERIRVLILDQNHFDVFPSNVYKMVNVEKVSLASQQVYNYNRSPFPALHQIPNGIEQMKALSTLLLFNNALMDIPSCLEKLENLRHLDVRLNMIGRFPPCLCNMPNLTKLYLSGNRIKSIPNDVKRMEGLKVLTMDNNEIEVIPIELCALKKLMYFAIRNNQLKELPQGLFQLENLLPNEEETMENRRFFIEGNPLVHPPVDHRTTTRDIFDYLRRFPCNPYISVEQEVVVRRSFPPSNPSADQFTVNSPYANVTKPSSNRATAFLLPDAESVEFDPILQQYMDENGLRIHKAIPYGGNSFFHALADQLQRPDIDLVAFTHTELRQKVVEYLKNAPGELQKRNSPQETADAISWMASNDPSGLDSYADKLSQDGEWPDEVAVAAAALVLRRDICVIAKSVYSLFTSQDCAKSPVWCSTFKGGKNGKPIHIAFVKSHFHSLGLTDEEKYDDTVLLPKQIFDLKNKRLYKLPTSVISDPSIEVLHLSRNHLTDQNWWSDLKSLPNLRSLDLSEQQTDEPSRHYKSLTIIPDDIHFYAENLSELVLSRNKILRLPFQLSFMKSLKVLDLIDNYITEIPEEFCDLQNLQYFGMSNNKLNCVPEKIGCLKSLLVLRLSHNALVELPESISDLENLQVLSLIHNKLVKLPLQFYKLRNLESGKIYKNNILARSEFHAGLSIEGNDSLKYPTLDICKRGTKSIFEYLRHMEAHPDQRDKILQAIPTETSMLAIAKHKFVLVKDTFLVELSKNLGREWRSLGISLGFEHSHLNIFEDNRPHDTEGAISDMLFQWRAIKCKHLNEDNLLKKLLEALGEAGRHDLKDKIKKNKRKSQVADGHR